MYSAYGSNSFDFAQAVQSLRKPREKTISPCKSAVRHPAAKFVWTFQPIIVYSPDSLP